MVTTITATQLSRNLSDILNRVKYAGERFVVLRNGEPIATIEPAATHQETIARELIASFGNPRMPGEGFADELEAVQAEQAPAEVPEWPD